MLDLQALLETQINSDMRAACCVTASSVYYYPRSSSATQDITHPIYAKNPYKKPCMCRSMISLSKIAHQMWHNHSLSHRKKATEQWEWGVGGNRKKGGGDKIWKWIPGDPSGWTSTVEKIIGSCSSKVRTWDRYFKTKYKT